MSYKHNKRDHAPSPYWVGGRARRSNEPIERCLYHNRDRRNECVAGWRAADRDIEDTRCRSLKGKQVAGLSALKEAQAEFSAPPLVLEAFAPLAGEVKPWLIRAVVHELTRQEALGPGGELRNKDLLPCFSQ